MMHYDFYRKHDEDYELSMEYYLVFFNVKHVICVSVFCYVLGQQFYVFIQCNKYKYTLWRLND